MNNKCISSCPSNSSPNNDRKCVCKYKDGYYYSGSNRCTECPAD